MINTDRIKNYKSYFIFFICVICVPFFSLAQQNQSDNYRIDSLISLIKTDKEDTGKVTHLYKLCGAYKDIGNYDTALSYGMAAMQLAAAIAKDFSDPVNPINKSAQKGIANACNNIAIVYVDQGNYRKAIDYYYMAIKIDEEIGNKNGMGMRLGNIGLVYYYQGDYPKALDYYFKAQKIYDELGSENDIAINNNNIGLVYWNNGDFAKSLEYFFKSLDVAEKIGYKELQSNTLCNIGNIYDEQKKYSYSLDYYFKALKIAESMGNKNGMAGIMGNLGIVYRHQGNNIKALKCYFEALKLAEELGNKNFVAGTLGNIGTLYIDEKEYSKAEKYLFAAVKLDKEIGTLKYEMDVENHLTELYSKTNRYQLALEHYKKAMALKDSIFNQEKEKDITRKEMNYEFEKKEAATQAEHDKHLALSEAEKKKQQIIIWSVMAGLFLVALILIIVVRSLRVTQRQKSVIEKQKEIVDEQRKTVEEKNKEISHKNKELTDSINYAQRIQSAILTSERYLNDLFLPQGQTSSHFILFKPKDIVAGDFYWAYKTPMGKAIWVAADCTGHGVPGAFMSMIGNSLLNEIVVEKSIHEPDEILNHLRAGIIKALGQGVGTEEKRKDGMDAAICAWDKQTNILKFSGANNSLWLMRKANQEISFDMEQGFPNTQGQIEETQLLKNEKPGLSSGALHGDEVGFFEIEPDIQPVGNYGEYARPFTKKEIQLQKGDTLYTFTDGYCDQFGGPKGKKFKYKPFRELLIKIHEKSMPEQREILDQTIDEWKGNLEQIDDICVFGVRV